MKSETYRCNLCGGKARDFEKVYTIDSFSEPFDIYRCSRCGLMFRYPMPSEDEVKSFYSEEYYTGKAEVSYIDERELGEKAKAVWKARLKKLSKMVETDDRPIRFLDVGCSFGGFVETAQEFGFESYGVELSEYSSKYAVSKGLNVFNGTLIQAGYRSDYFHIITMVELIEHLTDPMSYLKEAHRILKKGGVLLVQTANLDGIQAKFFGKDYHYFIPIHLHYFTSKTIKGILKKAGFSKVKVVYGVEFGLLPKLIKSSATFTKITDYLKWIRISTYHFLSKIHIGEKALMSSMVAFAWK